MASGIDTSGQNVTEAAKQMAQTGGKLLSEGLGKLLEHMENSNQALAEQINSINEENQIRSSIIREKDQELGKKIEKQRKEQENQFINQQKPVGEFKEHVPSKDSTKDVSSPKDVSENQIDPYEQQNSMDQNNDDMNMKDIDEDRGDPTVFGNGDESQRLFDQMTEEADKGEIDTADESPLWNEDALDIDQDMEIAPPV